MWRLTVEQPVTVSLSNERDQPYEWVDCVVRRVRGELVTLSAREPISARVRERLSGRELVFIVFEQNGAPVAFKGLALPDTAGTTLEFVMTSGQRERHPGSPLRRAVDDRPILRLVYISQAAAGLAETDFDDVLAVAIERNAEADISGALCLRSGFFVQLLEGPESAVRATYARIERDPRHVGPVILSEEIAARRLYDGWSMRGISEASAITASDELKARLGLARTGSDAATLTHRWLELLRSPSGPAWTSEWLSAHESVLFMRGLVEHAARSGPSQRH